MVSTQTWIVVLLVVAIVFSAASLMITLSLGSLKPLNGQPAIGNMPVAGNPTGGIGLVIAKGAGP